MIIRFYDDDKKYVMKELNAREIRMEQIVNTCANFHECERKCNNNGTCRMRAR